MGLARNVQIDCRGRVVRSFEDNGRRGVGVAVGRVALTAAVETEKFTDVAFAGTVTVGGTEAAELPLERLILAPPAGAGSLILTVPVIDCPPVTLDGFTLTELSAVGLADCGL